MTRKLSFTATMYNMVSKETRPLQVIYIDGVKWDGEISSVKTTHEYRARAMAEFRHLKEPNELILNVELEEESR